MSIKENIKSGFSPTPEILLEAQQGRQAKKPAAANILTALGIALAAMVIESLALIVIVCVAAIICSPLMLDDNALLASITSGSLYIVIALYITVFPIIALALYVKFCEKRSLRSMGFVKRHAARDYLLGILIAFAMFSICVGICVATGTMRFDSFALNGQYLMLAVIFVGYLIQGMSEEVICRGFMMTSIGSRSGALAGMLINSVVFGLLHLANDGVTLLSVVNIILFGIFNSLLVLKLNSIWMACAVHSIWNFVQGNFYGIPVSGIDSGASVFRFTDAGSSTLINGGSFGIEGGLAATIVLVVAIVLVMTTMRSAATTTANAAESSGDTACSGNSNS